MTPVQHLTTDITMVLICWYDMMVIMYSYPQKKNTVKNQH